MKKDIVKYYENLDRVDEHTADNEKRVREIKDFYKKVKKYFGESVLDLGRDGGLLGFIVENDLEKYRGVDINPDMIEAARDYAEEVGSKCEFVEADATEEIVGTFDTVTMIGNSLCHLTTFDFQGVLTNIEENVEQGTNFVVDYRDMVRMVYTGNWKKEPIREKGFEDLLSEDKRIDTGEGRIVKVAKDSDGNEKFEFSHALWSPFIIRALMKPYGWELIHKERFEEWGGWIDVYRKE